MAFSWLKVATTAFTFKTLLRHYAGKISLELYRSNTDRFFQFLLILIFFWGPDQLLLSI